MPPRHVRPIPIERLPRLTTARLVAYRNRLLALEESVDLSDWDPPTLACLDAQLIYFKDDPRWRPLYDAVASELSLRVPLTRLSIAR